MKHKIEFILIIILLFFALWMGCVFMIFFLTKSNGGHIEAVGVVVGSSCLLSFAITTISVSLYLNISGRDIK